MFQQILHFIRNFTQRYVRLTLRINLLFQIFEVLRTLCEEMFSLNLLNIGKYSKRFFRFLQCKLYIAVSSFINIGNQE